jgi:hypothetical protein
MSTNVKQETIRVLLEKYAIAPPPTDARFLSHAQTDAGVPVMITARIDPELGPMLRASINGEHAERACPLTEDAAMAIVEYLRSKRLIAGDAQAQRTLAHLLVKCGRMFAETGADELRLTPVYVAADGYRIHEVSMRTTKPIKAKPRLEGDAHDKGAVFTARPTGRRTGARK